MTNPYINGLLRFDPYLNYRFTIEIENMYAGGFNEISGLGKETKVKTLSEGGVNDYEHVFPEQTSYQNLVLKRGLFELDLVYEWYLRVVDGRVHRKHGAIVQWSQRGFPVMIWYFKFAIPVKWDGPTFSADQPQVTAESITLAHQGLDRLPLAGLLTVVDRGLDL